MRNRSTISATAGTDRQKGNGGNITISAPFIVAVPSENSDITANAFTGNGGNIQIATSGIFGTQFREDSTPQSDITASSEFGVDGEVEINTLDVDPGQGSVVLPSELVDVSGLIASGCGASVRQGESKFIVTGRGGLPIRPGDALVSPYPTGTVRSIPSSGSSSETSQSSVEGSDSSTNPTTPAPTQIVEALLLGDQQQGRGSPYRFCTKCRPPHPLVASSLLPCNRNFVLNPMRGIWQRQQWNRK